MKPLVDTVQFRDAIKQALLRASEAPMKESFEDGEGVALVPLNDLEAMSEGVYKPYTVKHWAGWVYQKRPDGKWDKLVRSTKSSASLPEDPKDPHDAE